jgi:hypothetical protein
VAQTLTDLVLPDRERDIHKTKKQSHLEPFEQMQKCTSKKANRSGKNFGKSACMHDAVEHQKTQQPKNWQQKNLQHFWIFLEE